MLSFVKVVENGGFSSAARDLNLAKSVVTTHVKALEERLSVRLLNRTTRSVNLTEAGRAYYERCIQILSEIQQAEYAAQVLQSKPRGVLRLNAHPAIPPLIDSSIAEYAALYPDVNILLTATSRMPDLVEEGSDLSIRYLAIPDPNLIVRRLGVFRMAVCASPEYLEKRGTPEKPADLERHNCLTYTGPGMGKNGKSWLFTGSQSDFTVEVSGGLQTNSPDALRGAAVRGQGLIFAPVPFVVADLKSGALVSVLDEFLPRQFSVDALYPHREHLPAKVRAFIDLLVKNFRQMDWDPLPIHTARERGRAFDPPPVRSHSVARTITL